MWENLDVIPTRDNTIVRVKSSDLNSNLAIEP